MFRKGELWRHRNCLDVDIIVVSVPYKNNDYTKLNVLYWNRHGKYIISNEADPVRVLTKDFHNWELLDERVLQN